MYLLLVDRRTEENEWTDETGEDDDMEYEPTTEGEGEDMPNIFQQLLDAAEEEGDDGDEYHGMLVHIPRRLLSLILHQMRSKATQP
jgi:hypothetical protein